MKGEPSDSRLAEANHAAVALLAAMTALVVAGIGFLSRWGFSDNSPLEWAKYVGLSWFLIYFSVLIRTLFGLPRPGDSGSWWNGHANLSLAALGLVAAGGILWDGSTGAGMETSVVRHPAAALFALVGILGFLCALFTVVRGQPFRIFVVLVLFAGFFSFYAAGASWGNGYLNPLFVESLCLGQAHIDTLFHATISNMLRSYGIVSTGLDGLPFVPYHFGSHWLFAAVSNLLHVRVIDFYNRGYPVVFVPFGVFSLATLALTIGRRFRSAAQSASFQPADSDTERRQLLPSRPNPRGRLDLSSGSSWRPVLSVWCLTRQASCRRRDGTPTSSASRTIFPSPFRSSRLPSAGNSSRACSHRVRGRFVETAAAIVVLAALAGLIGLLKISIMLVLGAAGLFLIIRLRLYRRASVIALVLCAGISMGCALRLTANPGYAQVSPFLPFGFLRANVGPQWWPYFWVIFYVWVWVYAAVRISAERLRTLSELIGAVAQRRLLDVEFLFVVAFVGALPGLVTNYSGTLFFSDYQRWLALALVLSLLVRRPHPAAETHTVGDDSDGQSVATRTTSNRSTMGGLRLGRIACAAIVLCIAGTLCANTLDLLGGMVTTNLARAGTHRVKPALASR